MDLITGDLRFSAGHVDIPPPKQKSSDQILDDTLRAIGELMRAEIYDISRFKLNGHPAISFTIEATVLGKTLGSRHLLAIRDHRVIMAAVESGTRVPEESEAETFLGSLILD